MGRLPAQARDESVPHLAREGSWGLYRAQAKPRPTVMTVSQPAIRRPAPRGTDEMGTPTNDPCAFLLNTAACSLPPAHVPHSSTARWQA